MFWSAPQADRSHTGLAHVVLPCPIQFRPSQNPGSSTPPPLRCDPILKPLWIFSLDPPQHWAPLPFREPGSSKMSSPPPILSALSCLECHKCVQKHQMSTLHHTGVAFWMPCSDVCLAVKKGQLKCYKNLSCTEKFSLWVSCSGLQLVFIIPKFRDGISLET